MPVDNDHENDPEENPKEQPDGKAVPVGGVGNATASEVEPKHVRKALADLLQSEGFAGSSQLSDFLSYIVGKALAGEQRDIKAYTIAVDALGKKEDFDPQSNAAVRVAAGRLRQTLNLYNAELERQAAQGWEGKTPPVQIALPRGSYVPVFSYLPVGLAQGEDNATAALKEGSAPEEVSFEGFDWAGAPVAMPPAGDAPTDQPLMTQDDLDELQGALQQNATPPRRTMARLGVRQTALLALAVGLFTALLVTAVIRFNADQKIVALLGLGSGATQQEETDKATGESQAPPPALASADPAKVPQIDVNLRPKVSLTLVFADAKYPDWFKKGELEDSIVLAMTRFDDYQFIGSIAGDSPPLLDNRDADYSLFITAYGRDNLLRVFGRLIRNEDGTVVWSTQQQFGEPTPLSGRNVPELAGFTYSPVGSPYGVIFADLLRSRVRRQKLACTLATYQYFSSKSDEGHRLARQCAEELRDAGSRLPAVYAVLTFLYLDEYREGRNADESDAAILRRAEEAARKAVEVGPQSARAQQALFNYYRVTGNVENARKTGQRALKLNPYDTDVIGNYAAWLIGIGQFEEGRTMLARMSAMLDARPAFVDAFRFLSYELEGDHVRANAVSDQMNYARSPMMAVGVALAAHRNGKPLRRNLALESLKSNDPMFLVDPFERLRRQGFSPSLARKLADRVTEAREAAGISLPNPAQ
ncbi:MAG: hypothetical protein AAGK33_01755 [Pseudomonadota bacterium]